MQGEHQYGELWCWRGGGWISSYQCQAALMRQELCVLVFFKSPSLQQTDCSGENGKERWNSGCDGCSGWCLQTGPLPQIQPHSKQQVCQRATPTLEDGESIHGQQYAKANDVEHLHAAHAPRGFIVHLRHSLDDLAVQ